jgi:hypothetical protein
MARQHIQEWRSRAALRSCDGDWACGTILEPIWKPYDHRILDIVSKFDLSRRSRFGICAETGRIACLPREDGVSLTRNSRLRTQYLPPNHFADWKGVFPVAASNAISNGLMESTSKI